MTDDQAGYVELVRGNPTFRRVYIGQVASLLGDWFNTIALYTVVLGLTGSPMALGIVFVTKTLPTAITSPLAGYIADRFDRWRLMIGSDLLRAAIVLGFLLVDETDELWLLYVLAAAQVIVSGVFGPAWSALLPNVTKPRELVTANALSSATWSVMLVIGAALGGVAAETLGVRAAFVIDSASYLVSAWFLTRIRARPRVERDQEPVSIATAFRGIAEGWRHIHRHRAIARVVVAKGLWASGVGAIAYMFALAGMELSPAAPSATTGLLYAAAGVGSGLGPVAARALAPDPSRFATQLGVYVTAGGVIYLILATAPWIWWMLPVMVLAHGAGGANWVMSTVSLQTRTEDAFRGRVFATEMLILTLMNALSILAASSVLEAGLLTLREAVLAYALYQCAAGLGYMLVLMRGETPRAAALGAAREGRAEP